MGCGRQGDSGVKRGGPVDPTTIMSLSQATEGCIRKVKLLDVDNSVFLPESGFWDRRLSFCDLLPPTLPSLEDPIDVIKERNRPTTNFLHTKRILFVCSGCLGIVFDRRDSFLLISDSLWSDQDHVKVLILYRNLVRTSPGILGPFTVLIRLEYLYSILVSSRSFKFISLSSIAWEPWKTPGLEISRSLSHLNYVSVDPEPGS